jgi:hypothetical protein
MMIKHSNTTLLPCSYLKFRIFEMTHYENSSFFVLILYLITTPLFAQKKLQYGTLESAGLDFNSGIPLR